MSKKLLNKDVMELVLEVQKDQISENCYILLKGLLEEKDGLDSIHVFYLSACLVSPRFRIMFLEHIKDGLENHIDETIAMLIKLKMIKEEQKEREKK